MESDITALLDLAERAARAAGELICARRPADVRVVHTKSSPIDIVTQMDTASEQLIRDLILSERPDDGLLGEEDAMVEGSSGLTWVIDPIDGTVNYLYGLPSYAVSIACVSGGSDPATWRALAGCVHAPALGRTWTAGERRGAYRDGAPIAVTRLAEPSQALIATGFGYAKERKLGQGRVLAQLIGEIRDIRRIGSAAIDLCLVAEGTLDGHYERGLSPWDLAAGALIVQEAGGTVLGLGDQGPGREMLVAGGPHIAPWLAGRLRELDAGTDGA